MYQTWIIIGVVIVEFLSFDIHVNYISKRIS